MTQAHDVIVITSCTNRKKRAANILSLRGADTAHSIGAVASAWKRQIDACDAGALHAAAELYGGRSIIEAKRTAQIVSAPLYIVSAGQGLIRSDEPIPSYDVTVATSPGNQLYECLVRLGKTSADWWRALVDAFGRERSLADLFARTKTAVVLLAVPSAYLTLLASELAALSEAERARLRIITSPYGATRLTTALQPTVMPYDDRLEGMTSYAGTRSDFPQRALRHFVAVLGGHELTLEAATNRVREAMDSLVKPALPQRKRKTDDEIKALLFQNWDRFNGSASALLRYLRDEALVACEQSRFSLLRRQVLSQLNDNTGHNG